MARGPLCTNLDQGKMPVIEPQAETLSSSSPYLEDQTLREAFQIHPRPVPFEQRLALLEQLALAGLRRFQVGALVRPDRMPQMADCERFAQYAARMPGIEAWIMVFNHQGLARAAKAGFKRVALSASLSEIHSGRNLNCTVAQGLDRCLDLAGMALNLGMQVRMGLQCAFGGPMLSPASAHDLLEIFKPFHGIGVDRLALADTAARALPHMIGAALGCLRRGLPEASLGLHLHGEEPLLECNLRAAWLHRAAWLDVTLDGRGGCPFLPKQPKANLSSALTARFLKEKGVDLNIDWRSLDQASAMLQGLLSGNRAACV